MSRAPNRALGQHLMIRAMAYVAGEPVPFFWPMRSFIHHNPLHGLEHLPFEQAVAKGTQLFHARGYLPRTIYQGYLGDGRMDRDSLTAQIQAFIAARPATPEVDLHAWLRTLLEQTPTPVMQPHALAGVDDVLAAPVARKSTEAAHAPTILWAHVDATPFPLSAHALVRT